MTATATGKGMNSVQREPRIRTDVVIVGAGPVGLYGAYCAGFRGLRTVVVDALAEPGGQISALYPEKEVRDVAGIPRERGRGLVSALLEQASTYGPELLLGRRVLRLDRAADGTPVVGLCDGTEIEAGAVVLTAGIGTFTPRSLPGGQEWEGRGLRYFVPDPAGHRDERIVIAGGGDSAVDWAHALAPVAHSVVLVHRRDRFRAHAANVTALAGTGVEVLTGTEIVALEGDDRLRTVTLRTRGEPDRVTEVDTVIAALGFVSDLGPLAEWGLELRGRAVLVDQRMRTTVPRVYAAGDLADHEGKVRLMSVGFGEVATAVGNAAVELDPARTLFPGHSTDEQA